MKKFYAVLLCFMMAGIAIGLFVVSTNLTYLTSMDQTTHKIVSGHEKLITVNGEAFPSFSTDGGAWCWFQDPRAVYNKGIHEKTYSGWVTKAGALQVGSYDHSTNTVTVVTLRKKWQKNDHANPAFLIRPDRRIMMFYSVHNGKSIISRLSRNPEDISAWEKEITISSKGRFTYPNPMQLSGENNRIYLLWRGQAWKPMITMSYDGVNWTRPRVLIQEKGRESYSIRPYLKAYSNGKDTFHLAFTDGHPENEPHNSIYYVKYQNGAFYKADGTWIKDLAEIPIRHSEADLVYDGGKNNVRAWVWDVASDESGNPVIVYTRLPKETDHRYHYARWNGFKWEDHEITTAGGWFPQTLEGKSQREPHYSGGIVLNHANPSVVYLSKPTDGVFEIEKWTTSDDGKTWKSERITSRSTNNNVCPPVVPREYKGVRDHVLWMNGDYVHYIQHRNQDADALRRRPQRYTGSYCVFI